MKPKPPDDLWQQMDAAIGPLEPPLHAKCVHDFADHYHLSFDRAKYLVRTLVEDGKLTYVGSWHGKRYYTVPK